MADQQALINALQNLVAAMAANNNNIPVPTAHVPILDPFNATSPFDLGTRAGSFAWSQACSPLTVKWDGNIENLPPFLIALRIRAQEVKWDAPPPHGILTFTTQGANKNLLQDYHSITPAMTEAARVARADPRAIQNSLALYTCVKNSIEGTLQTTMFDQGGNLLETQDGCSLLIRLLGFTTASSLQLSIDSLGRLQTFDPTSCNFDIGKINTQMLHLFVLATTGQRQLGEPEKLQHVLTCYTRIQQPAVWLTWVTNQIELFDAGQLTNCQDFMNKADAKAKKIAAANGGVFGGKTTTVQDDIMAMFSQKQKLPSSNKRKPDSDGSSAPPTSTKLPPWVRHFKKSTATDAEHYKVGDSKEFDGKTWYFCDCPLHKDRVRFHTHTAESCRTRTRWIADGSPPARGAAPSANPADGTLPSPTSVDAATPAGAPSPSATDEATVLLASALSQVGHNPLVSEMIADALNTLQRGA